ncbi:hypothetical protein P872_11535 [Rhodonellum psychrophilum GCM71 = DSM 17998]|uniref:Peptide O-xylosyltransferase n=2 Tax=Rhodonellum TaxID=336827 RepID=U5BYQ0_9BACT|nr:MULTISPECIES: beta-1,6-N-acetylglucosaminyltransferase [Rhodonellum]ERM81027.1 hypothetical protein P872_11535 [Rhodonellum psychrophilum GCM71 = DSM 17998]SDZ41609.1 Core-2/I-Branching enzyme [Rhodonellum ikkaensis]
MSKHAILLLGYKNIEQICDYINLLDEDFDFYIHLDKKSKISQERILKIRSFKNVKFIGQVYKVNWGGKKFLEAFLYLAKEALKEKSTKYIHTTSEADLPIKSPAYIKEFFIKNDGKQYVEFFSIPTDRWVDGGLDRFNKYNFYDKFNFKTKIGFKIIIYLLKIQKLIGVNRNISKNFPPLYGGSTWCSLSRSCIEYSLEYTEKNPNFLKSLTNTFAPEEIFFQTILMDSPFKNDIVNDNLVYIDWVFRNGNSPAPLDMSDLEKLKKSDKLFARKIQPPISEDLKIELLKYLKT